MDRVSRLSFHCLLLYTEGYQTSITQNPVVASSPGISRATELSQGFSMIAHLLLATWAPQTLLIYDIYIDK